MGKAAGRSGLITVGAPSAVNPAFEHSDEALVSRIRAGEEAAFVLLFERYRRRVAGIAKRFFPRHEQIEDIIQVTFTKVYFSIGDYGGERETSFVAWLSRIAVNACYDELRRAKRRPESLISELTEDEETWLNTRLQWKGAGADAESAAVARDLATKLLARLGADDRLVLTLLDADDLSASEVAELTGWSVAKVKVRAHRARVRLRSVLKRFL